MSVWSSLGNVISQLGHFMDQLSSLENQVALTLTAIERLTNAFEPDRVEAKMQLVEVENLLKRCNETILTGKEQVVALAKLGSGHQGRQARRQIKKGKLNPQLAEALFLSAKTRVKHIQETVDRFKALRTPEGMQKAEENIRSLDDDRWIPKLVATGRRLASTVFQYFFGGATAGSVLALLGMGGVAVTEKIAAAAAHLETNLDNVRQAFMNAHKDLHDVSTAMHKLLEQAELTKGHLEASTVVQGRQARKSYQRAGLQDDMETLLNGLDKLKGKLTPGYDTCDTEIGGSRQLRGRGRTCCCRCM